MWRCCLRSRCGTSSSFFFSEQSPCSLLCNSNLATCAAMRACARQSSHTQLHLQHVISAVQQEMQAGAGEIQKYAQQLADKLGLPAQQSCSGNANTDNAPAHTVVAVPDTSGAVASIIRDRCRGEGCDQRPAKCWRSGNGTCAC